MNNKISGQFLTKYGKAQRRRLALYLVTIPIPLFFGASWSSRYVRRAILALGWKMRRFLSVYLIHMGRLRIAREIASETDCLPEALRARLESCLDVLDNAGPTDWEPRNTRPGQPKFNGRVLLALHSALPRHIAGYAIRSHTILKALRTAGISAQAITRPGYPMDVDDPPTPVTEQYDDEIYRHIPPPSVPMNGGPDDDYIQAYRDGIIRVATETGAGLIHGCSNYLGGLAAIEAAKRMDVPAIYEMRGLWHLTQSVTMPWLRDSDLMRYQEAMEMRAARRADAVVTLSRQMRDRIVDWGVSPDRVHVIGNAVDTEKFTPAPAPDRIPPTLRGAKIVGYIGSLVDYEGVDDLIAATEILLRNGQDIGLLIVGDGRERRALERRAARLIRSGRAHFTGQVPPGDVMAYYRQCDILPLPRKDSPLSRLVPPLKPLEIMAMGKALVVSDLPALRETGRSGQTHLTCRADSPQSLADALAQLLGNDVLRESLGRQAREWVVSERSLTSMGKKFADLYASL